MTRQTKMLIMFGVVLGSLCVVGFVGRWLPEQRAIVAALREQGCDDEPRYTRLHGVPSGFDDYRRGADTVWRADACGTSWQVVVRTTVEPGMFKKHRRVDHDAVFIKDMTSSWPRR